MTKKLAVITSAFAYLASTVNAFAQPTIFIERPTVGGNKVGYENINDFIKNSLTLAFIIAMVVFLAMLIWGAIEWILSGGEKEAVGKARGRIVNGLIGLAILAVALAIVQVAGSFLGLNILNTQLKIPGPP